MATIDNTTDSVIAINSTELDHLRSNVLRSQIATYRRLARNLPVSDNLLNLSSYKFQLANLIQNHVEQEQSKPTSIILTNTTNINDQTDKDKLENFSSATNLYQCLVGSNETNINHISKDSIHLNPLYIQYERDKRIKNRMLNRLHELEQMPANMNVELRTQALIEFKSLKLFQYQKQLRQEVLNTMKKDTYIQTALNSRSYKRPKRHQLREARSTESYERQRKLEIQQQKHEKHKNFLNTILTHAKEFREYHRRCTTTIGRMNKSIQTYFANSERELNREKERREKDRLKRLMLEDEDGYRKLVDEKKDARLALLLSQTDDYINSLKQLVRQHQQVIRPREQLTKLTTDQQSSNSTSTINETNQGNKNATATTTKNEDDEYDAKESYYSIAHRIREPITQQSKLLVGGQLKPYQLEGLEWLVSLYNNNLNGILADEMGLGKTIQTIALIVHLLDVKKNTGPSLIIVPLSTLSNWASEFQRWAPDVSVIQYKGLPPVRRILAQTIRTQRFNVLLTTYEYIMRDRSILSRVPWKYLIIDEGHRMKNHHCKLTQILNTHYSNASHRLLLTGTPLQNNLSELWALLNFILPTIFKSSTTFTDWFNAPFATLPSEKVELNHEETLLIIRRLHKVLRPFLLRRLKKEVESQLPEKVEYIIKCELSALQRCLYHAMSKNRTLIIENQNGKSGRRALMNKIMQLRKICNHPFLFKEIEERLAQSLGYKNEIINGPDLFRVSGKFELLDRILPKLKASGHKILLFCQMTTVMDLLESYFSYRDYSYIRLDGSTKADDRCELLKNFNDDKNNYFIFLLSTRSGGVGLNLQKADTVILFDSDWNPHQDLQAQDRAHRIGQQNEVRVLRLMTVNTIEEKILACARHKLNVDEKVIQAGMFNRSSTSSERHNYLEQLIEVADELKDDEDIPDNEILNQMIARTEDEFDLFNRIDIARHEYESIHGVGSGGDGLNARRAWKLSNTNDNRKNSLRIKRKKENDNEISTTKSNKTSTSFLEQTYDDDESRLTITDDITSSTLDEFDDEEDVDFTSEVPTVHRKMKINRLITENELPEWLKSNVDEVEKTLETEEHFGKGCRQRKDIDYSDNLTEKEFLQALEDGNIDDIIEQKRGKKFNRKTGTTSDNNSIDLDENETFSSFDNQSTKRGSIKKRSETNNPTISQQCRLLYDHLLAFRTDEDRQLAQIFIRLPSQKQLPLYYQIIEQPIDFQRIKRKIDSQRYSNLEEFDADMKLLVENAQTFNCETSTIYSDSIQLEKVYQDVRQQLRMRTIEIENQTSDITNKSSITSRISPRQGRSTRTVTPVTTMMNANKSKISTRGRKRKVIVFEEDDDDDEQNQSDNEE